MKPPRGKSLTKRRAERKSILAKIEKRREAETANWPKAQPHKRLPYTAQAKYDAAKPTQEELVQPYRAIRNLKMALIEYQSGHLANIKTLERIQESHVEVLGRQTSDFEHASGGAIRTHVRRLSAAITNLVAKMRTAENKRKANLDHRGSKKAAEVRTRGATKRKLDIADALNEMCMKVPETKTWKPAKVARTMNKKGSQYRYGKKVTDRHLAKIIRCIRDPAKSDSTAD